MCPTGDTLHAADPYNMPHTRLSLKIHIHKPLRCPPRFSNQVTHAFRMFKARDLDEQGCDETVCCTLNHDLCVAQLLVLDQEWLACHCIVALGALRCLV